MVCQDLKTERRTAELPPADNSPARKHHSLCVPPFTRGSRRSHMRIESATPPRVHVNTTIRLIGSDTPEAEYKRPNPEVRCDPRPPLVTAILGREFDILGSIAPAGSRTQEIRAEASMAMDRLEQ